MVMFAARVSTRMTASPPECPLLKFFPPLKLLGAWPPPRKPSDPWPPPNGWKPPGCACLPEDSAKPLLPNSEKTAARNSGAESLAWMRDCKRRPAYRSTDMVVGLLRPSGVAKTGRLVTAAGAFLAGSPNSYSGAGGRIRV